MSSPSPSVSASTSPSPTGNRRVQRSSTAGSEKENRTSINSNTSQQQQQQQDLDQQHKHAQRTSGASLTATDSLHRQSPSSASSRSTSRPISTNANSGGGTVHSDRTARAQSAGISSVRPRRRVAPLVAENEKNRKGTTTTINNASVSNSTSEDNNKEEEAGSSRVAETSSRSTASASKGMANKSRMSRTASTSASGSDEGEQNAATTSGGKDKHNGQDDRMDIDSDNDNDNNDDNTVIGTAASTSATKGKRASTINGTSSKSRASTSSSTNANVNANGRASTSRTPISSSRNTSRRNVANDDEAMQQDDEENGDEDDDGIRDNDPPVRANSHTNNGDAQTEDEEEGQEEEERQNGDALPSVDKQQSMADKRLLRKDYRGLTSNLMSDRQQNPDALNTKDLRDGIKLSNQLFAKVTTPFEAVLDSSFLNLTSNITLDKARKLKVGGDYFDTDEYLARLKTVVAGSGAARRLGNYGRRRRRGRDEIDVDSGEEENHGGGEQDADNDDDDDDDDDEDGGERIRAVDPLKGWSVIGKLASRFTLRVPPIGFMLGPLAIPQKVKVVKQRKAREAKAGAGEKVKPMELTGGELEVAADKDKATPELVRHVSDMLALHGGEEGINLFKFLVNPHSFTQTVENLFYVSFLVKEKKASIDISPDMEPTIMLAEPPSEEDREGGDLTARQLVVEFDMQMWRDAIEAYDLTESTIPHRTYDRVVRGTWY